MLQPRTIGCPDCKSFNSLIKEIDCKIATEGNNIYNNISFLFNRNIPIEAMIDMLIYRRILQYKYVKSSYISQYSLEQIINRVKRHTVGIKCNNCECNYSQPPVDGNLYTTTTTSTSSTTTTSTSTSTSTSTTTTTSTTQNVVPCLSGFVIETIYIHQLSDLGLLPSGYTHPCVSQIGQHICNRANIGIYANGEYIGDSVLNNGAGQLSGNQTEAGNYIFGDYNNTPSALVNGSWTGNQFSRYTKITLTQQQAEQIGLVSGDSTITFSLVYDTIASYNAPPHNDVTWIRLTNSSGTVVYNGCPSGNFTQVNVCQ